MNESLLRRTVWIVHGEFEPNGIVESFGGQLEGLAFTEAGWIQSYGTRYVSPPATYGDASRRKPTTVKGSARARPPTCKPVKGTLTCPITMGQ